MIHPDRVDVELQASIPTPVLDLTAMGLPGKGRLLVKNDGASGRTYGGNKTRKLAPLFRALRARGVSHVLTMGTAGSHHVLAMGLFGPAEHVRVSALLFPQVHTPHTERVLRVISTLDLELLPLPNVWSLPVHGSKLFTRNATWVGPGALGVTSTRGYVAAYEEWRTQRQELDLGPDTFEHHVVAAGSGGTAAGLLAGMCASKQPGRVVAVAINDNPTLRSLIVAQALGAGDAKSARRVLERSRLYVTFEALGAGYGHPTAGTHHALEQASRFGITLDHTYTAKAFSVATRLCDAHPKDVVIFWQTLSQHSLEPWLTRAPPLSHLAPALRRLVVL